MSSVNWFNIYWIYSDAHTELNHMHDTYIYVYQDYADEIEVVRLMDI